MSLTKISLAALALVLVLSATVAGNYAAAQPAAFSQGTYGAVTLSANTATAIPSSGLAGRQAVAVQNLNATAIFCGWDSSVATTTGWQVAANGGSTSFDIGSAPSNLSTLYCITSVTQTSTTNVRVIEVRR